MILFKTFKSWKEYFFNALKNLLLGVARIIWSVIAGAISVLAAIGRSINAFCRREFKAALIIGATSFFLIMLWMGTFVSERSARVTAEYQRDSLSMKLDSAKQFNHALSDPLNHWNGNE